MYIFIISHFLSPVIRKNSCFLSFYNIYINRKKPLYKFSFLHSGLLISVIYFHSLFLTYSVILMQHLKLCMHLLLHHLALPGRLRCRIQDLRLLLYRTLPSCASIRRLPIHRNQTERYFCLSGHLYTFIFSYQKWI